jgi:hypothetical protein
MTVYNVPAYAAEYPYVVVREVEGEYWFYGAYENVFRASKVAYEVHGHVIKTDEIKG